MVWPKSCVHKHVVARIILFPGPGTRLLGVSGGMFPQENYKFHKSLLRLFLNQEFLANRILIIVTRLHSEALGLQIAANILLGNCFLPLFLGKQESDSL